MATSTEVTLLPGIPGIEQAKHILCRLFRDFDGCLRICLWDGSEVHLGRDHPLFSLTFRSAKAFQDLVLARDPLRLAESYFQGLIDVEGDFYSALKLRHYLASLQLSLIEKITLAAKAFRIQSEKIVATGSDTTQWVKTFRQKLGLESSKQLNRQAISFHYDVSNDFYALWLDQQMVIPALITKTPARAWSKRSVINLTTFVANCGSNPVSDCSTSAAAGAL